jgi:hypothetical protein
VKSRKTGLVLSFQFQVFTSGCFFQQPARRAGRS